MEKIITSENLRNFTYVNDAICAKPIKGIVLSFFGLGGASMFWEDTEEGKFFAEKGILFVMPYNNPWAWMNKQAVGYTDEIIDVLFKKYSLSKDTPIVSTGLSMGGQSALVYTYYSKRTPVACVANCPVCDMVFHYTERVDLPRTLYSALYNEEGTMEEALQKISPLHLADKMPKINYHIFHCSDDKAVNIESHSKKFVEAMKTKNHSITFDIAEGRGHCDLTDELKELFNNYCVNAVYRDERTQI